MEIKNRFTGEKILEIDTLFRANLRGANLREANLREVDLYGADLRGADLQDCNGILSFICGQHLGVYFKHKDTHYFKIGCITNTSDWWLKSYERVGRLNDYSEESIRLYGEIIKLYSSYELLDE